MLDPDKRLALDGHSFGSPALGPSARSMKWPPHLGLAGPRNVKIDECRVPRPFIYPEK
jgi:hypothetical protein